MIDCLALLTDHFGLEISTLKLIQSEFMQAIQAGKIDRIDILKSRFSDRHGISGTAVIPNLEVDPEWQQERNAITKRFQIQVEAERKRLVFLIKLRSIRHRRTNSSPIARSWFLPHPRRQ